jgi:segregation and condensation protein B
MLSKRGVLEAILFSSPEPVKKSRIAEVMQIDEDALEELLQEISLSLSSDDRGVVLREVAEGLQLVTKPEAHELVRAINAPRQYRLSKPTLEVLAIIAYKQPVTRMDIEDLRGVKCERAILTLLDRGLIREVGRKESIGRPILYGTTDAFLVQFNLRCLQDLPNPGAIIM